MKTVEYGEQLSKKMLSFIEFSVLQIVEILVARLLDHNYVIMCTGYCNTDFCIHTAL
jgi:hypothetical protein